jgi:hypothetical protein
MDEKFHYLALVQILGLTRESDQVVPFFYVPEEVSE